MFAISRVLEKKFIFIITDKKSCIRYTADSFGSIYLRPRMPRRNETFSPDDYRNFDCRVTKASYGEGFIYGIEHADTNRTDVAIPSASSSSLMSLILDALPLRGDEKEKVRRIVNGIVGSYNSSVVRDTRSSSHAPLSEREYISGLRRRFINRRSEIGSVVSHPDFDNYLLAKGHELYKRI